MRSNIVLTIFHTQNIHHHVWKTARTTLQSNVGLQLRGEGHEMENQTVGQICPIVFLAIQIFPPGLENNETSKCGTDSFPRMMTYMLCVEKLSELHFDTQLSPNCEETVL